MAVNSPHHILISVVLPCYKDAPHLGRNVQKIAQTLDLLRSPYEIILVDDASPDGTGAVADEIAEELGQTRVSVIHHGQNRGRGGAFLSGARQARGEIVGYLDVDLEVSCAYLPECIRLIVNEGADLVIGQRHYRLNLGLIHRHIVSRCYARLVSTVLGIPKFLDSESGYKFFRRTALEPYLDSFIHEGWFWDTEVTSRFHDDDRRIASLPCLFQRDDGKESTVRVFRDAIEYAINLLKYQRARRAFRKAIQTPPCPQQTASGAAWLRGELVVERGLE